MAKITKNQKYGFIDFSGNIILPCEYAEIEPFKEGIAIISKTNKYGVINKFGIVNSSGKIIIPCDFDLIRILSNNSIAVRLNKTWKCFNKEGKNVTETDVYLKKLQIRRKIKRVTGWFFFIIVFLSGLAVLDSYTNIIGAVHKVQIAIYGEDEMDWRFSRNNLTISGIGIMKTYLSKHPNGRYADSAKKAIEENEWKKAEILNTTSSYITYLEEYPEGKFSEIAKEIILWDRTQLANDMNSYTDFISKYPDGKFTAIALEKMNNSSGNQPLK